MWAWALLGRIVYRVGGIIALPIFLNDTTRTRVALIDKQKKTILLNKTWIGAQNWSLVGGGVDKEEDFRIGAVREIAEETGLHIDQNQLKHLGEVELKEYFARFRAHVFVVFVEEFEPQAPRLEILESSWFSLQKLPNVSHPQTIKMVNSELKKQG